MARYKQRDKRSLQRRRARKALRQRVLIVCEGARSEPDYLKALVADLRLHTTDVKVSGDGGSAPESVVKHALKLFDKDLDYDRVYCVFDRDTHGTFDRAIARIRKTKLIRRDGKKRNGKAVFEACTSIPCFEFWILLHYTYTTTEFASCDEVINRLEQHWPSGRYDKGNSRLYVLTRSRIDTAIANAEKANRAATQAGVDTPTTQMPGLIRYLRQQT